MHLKGQTGELIRFYSRYLKLYLFSMPHLGLISTYGKLRKL